MRASSIQPYFSQEDLRKLFEVYNKIDSEKNEIIINYNQFNYLNDLSREYAMHGLMRRINILNRAIHNIYTICPPEQADPINAEIANDTSINLQAFIMNVFGCLDNIAWTWKHHKNLDLKRHDIGLKPTHKKLRKTFSKDFQKHLDTFDDWFKYIENYRDALAHRIPVYVPPYTLNKDEEVEDNKLEKEKWNALLINKDINESNNLTEKQGKLGRFYPWMTHSFLEESKTVVFHSQILADWATIIDLSNAFFYELSIDNS